MAEKSELRTFGEIAKRVSEMSPAGKTLLLVSLEDGATSADLALIKQVVERYETLTAKGKEYVDGTLGVDRTPAK